MCGLHHKREFNQLRRLQYQDVMPVLEPNICLRGGAQHARERYSVSLSEHTHEVAPHVRAVLHFTRLRTSNRQAPQRASRAAGALMTASLCAQTTTDTPAA